MSDLTQKRVEEVAHGLFRLGTGLTGYYLLEEKGRYTMIDGAFPKYFTQLEQFLASRGASIEAIEAQVLTHHHPDHRGMTERIRTEAGGAVWIHQLDESHLTDPPRPPLAPIWRPTVFRSMAHMIRHGIVRTPPVLEASTYGDGERLDVPGRLRTIHVPGHTGGNTALSVEGSDLILTGDALITVNIYTWDIGPRIPADFFNDDSHVALESLDRLASTGASVLLPGHGPIWRGDIRDATARARSIGVY